MIEFKSSYVAIPLPDEYQEGFQKVQAGVSKINHLARLVPPNSAHITTYFLGQQSKENLEGPIKKAVESRLGELKGAHVNVGGYGEFTKHGKLKVVFLEVSNPKQLSNFNLELRRDLRSFYPSSGNMPFHPHITVAKFDESDNKTEREIQELFNSTRWVFPTSKVAIYANSPEEKDIIIENLPLGK